MSGQAAYEVPSDLHRMIWLSVNGLPYDESDEQVVQEYVAGTLALRSSGVYFVSFDDAGAESVTVYPTPDSDGKEIASQFVYEPETMTADDDVPAVPSFSHRAIVDYAASVAYGLDEDNAELEAEHLAKFEVKVERLRQLRLGRQAPNPQDLIPSQLPQS